jgi:hypothetical protein
MAREGTRIKPNEIIAANNDLFGEIERRGIDLLYDEVLDTLFVEIGGPRKALNVHVDEDIMLRVDPITMEVVGGEIVLYSYFRKHRQELADSIEKLGVRKDCEVSAQKPPEEGKKIGELLQDWIALYQRNEPAMWNGWLEQRSP